MKDVRFTPGPNPLARVEQHGLVRIAGDLSKLTGGTCLGELQGSLDVPEGGVYVLLGRNGAGKTTTLRTIMGLWQARRGSIRSAPRCRRKRP